MRPATTGLLRLAVALSSLTTLAAAWPGWLPERDALIARADDGEQTSPTSSIPGATIGGSVTLPPTSSATKKPDSKSSASNPNSHNLNDATPEGTGTGTGTKGHQTAGPTHTTFSPVLPPGGVSVTQPTSLPGTTPLVKIGDWVTWGWNYTSLLGTPNAIDVLISCAVATETWTLTTNMTFETSVSYLWDTSIQEDNVEDPLLTELYTLIVKDTDVDITAPAEAGYLGAYTGYTFGMYQPMKPTPLADWSCTGCSAANSVFDHPALGLAVGMSVLTFASFTWFVTGLGLH